MQAEIENDKLKTLAKLQAGLTDKCADDIVEMLINLDTGTCDYLSLIPVLEEIARVEWFYYFDDNGAGGAAHPVTGDRTNLKSWALKAIDNIRENGLFESASMIHSALKSNNTELIKTTLEHLKAEKKIADKSLIPILEKIARKDVYKKYSYMLGFETDCQLGDLAKAVVQIITLDPASADTSDKPTSTPREEPGKCSVCSSLPDDLTVNTGREEYFPGAFNQLVGMDDDRRAEFRCCPACRTYFQWFDMTQMYGSGNNDEERLVRLSGDRSRLLDKLFKAELSYRPTSSEFDEYVGSLPLDLLVAVLSFQLHRNRELIRSFVPRLITLLGKNNDDSLWGLLNGYANSPERAEHIVDAFRSSDEYPQNRLIQIIHHCLKLLKKG